MITLIVFISKWKGSRIEALCSSRQLPDGVSGQKYNPNAGVLHNNHERSSNLVVRVMYPIRGTWLRISEKQLWELRTDKRTWICDAKIRRELRLDKGTGIGQVEIGVELPPEKRNGMGREYRNGNLPCLSGITSRKPGERPRFDSGDFCYMSCLAIINTTGCVVSNQCCKSPSFANVHWVVFMLQLPPPKRSGHHSLAKPTREGMDRAASIASPAWRTRGRNMSLKDLGRERWFLISQPSALHGTWIAEIPTTIHIG